MIYDEHQIGAHRLSFIEPNIVKLTLCGDLSGDDMDEITETSLSWDERGEVDLVLLVDISDVGRITLGARERMGRTKAKRKNPTALYGGTFAQRTLLKAVVRILALGSANKSYFRMFLSQKEAIAWLHTQSEELYGPLSSSVSSTPANDSQPSA